MLVAVDGVVDADCPGDEAAGFVGAYGEDELHPAVAVGRAERGDLEAFDGVQVGDAVRRPLGIWATYSRLRSGPATRVVSTRRPGVGSTSQMRVSTAGFSPVL